mgnify:CR=1 FL=1|tara:strand:- start:392 stop:1396 length:1005 start_codon:yes stop_codon:yes gene_type:complete
MKNIFIIAEIGVTCNYDLSITEKLIKSAKDSGADAVKFVFHFPDELMSDKEVLYTYKTLNGEVTENMYDMFESLTFTLDEWHKVKQMCIDNDIELFSSVDGKTSVKWGEELGFNYYKVGTWDVSDVNLFKDLAKLNKKVMVDIGASPEEEIKEMIDIVGTENIIILHDYHTNKYDEMNMQTIKYLSDKYGIMMGFSSPDSYDINDYVAVGMGIKFIEKRLTLDRNLEGHHHILSKTPDEFKEWVKNIKNAEKSVGRYGIFPSENDLKDRDKFFKHLCADVDISKGDVITEDMMASKRPETSGLKPNMMKEFVGKVAITDIKRNQAITKNEVENV